MISKLGALSLSGLQELGSLVGMVRDTVWEIVERVSGITESVNENMKRLTGPESDLAATIKNTKTFVAMLNKSPIPQVIENAEQLTDVLKKEPWRLLWPSKPPVTEEAPKSRKSDTRPEGKRPGRAVVPKTGR